MYVSAQGWTEGLPRVRRTWDPIGSEILRSDHMKLTQIPSGPAWIPKKFIDTDDNCTHCKQAPEDIQHIFLCPASQPAVNWMWRKIDGIAPELAKENHFSIFTLNFSIVDSNRKFSLIRLIANFINAIWHSRIEPTYNIIARVLADMKPKIENLKKNQLYSNCFYLF